MYSGCAPGRVLRHHSKYEVADFLRNPSSAKQPAGSGDETPIECESRSVPTYHRLRAHHDESLFPSRPEPPRQNPEELIECFEPGPRMPPLQCRQLLAKNEILQKESTMSAEEAKDRGTKLGTVIHSLLTPSRLFHVGEKEPRRLAIVSESPTIPPESRWQSARGPDGHPASASILGRLRGSRDTAANPPHS
jgi:hypothetical protein